MHEDIERIKSCYNYSYQEKLINKLEKDIINLTYMPRIHKTLTASNDKDGEYRRMISGNYSIIYKIKNNKIIILRIFNQKEDYLNNKNFMLKEGAPKYLVNRKGDINMIKFRTLKNSYAKLKENYTHINTEEEVLNRYMNILIDEAEESLKTEGYITLEEWREELIREYNVNI